VAEILRWEENVRWSEIGDLRLWYRLRNLVEPVGKKEAQGHRWDYFGCGVSQYITTGEGRLKQGGRRGFFGGGDFSVDIHLGERWETDFGRDSMGSSKQLRGGR